jgi:transcriptional regulator with GAF, ATPase, and Fis domain
MPIASFRKWWTWQKILILGSAAWLVVYVGGVLWHVQTMPDIGLHCTFRPVVNRIYPEYLRSADGRPVPDLVGAVIEQVGSQRVETWPQMLRALESLEKLGSEPAERPAGGHADIRSEDGADWVRVRLRTPDAQPTTVSVWCRIGRSPPAVLVPTILWFALELGVFAVAAFVFWKRPGDRPTRQFFVLTVVFITAFMAGYHWSRIVTHPSLLLGFIVSAVLLPAVSLHFYLLFPRPKRALEARPFLTLGLTYGPAVLFAAAITAGYVMVHVLDEAEAPAANVQAALDLLRRVIFAYFAVAAALYLAGVVCLTHSYRSARDVVERNQVRWILYGSVLATLPLGYSLFLALFHRQQFGGGAALWPMFAASVCFSGSFTVSITRYRLLQLDQLISAGVAYFLVSGTAAAVYYALVFVGTLVLGSRGAAGPSLEQAFWVSGGALVLTVGLDLARSRLLRALDRRFRRDKTQLDRTLQRLGTAIEQLVDPPTLARRLLHAAADLLGVQAGAVYLRDGEPPVFRAVGHLGPAPAVGELSHENPLALALLEHEVLPPRRQVPAPADALGQLSGLGGAVVVALAHEGSLRAFLVLGPKASGGSYTAEDLDLLAAFAPFTALALASAEGHRTIEVLNRELHTKVEKISEQQRRILALQQQLTTQAKYTAPAAEPAPGDAPPEPLAGGAIVGGSAALRQVLALARKVAASPSAVLVRGESGTGKGLLAKAVHDASPRAGKPFVKVHCAALAAGLLESELFGHVKGAFTGAVKDKVGRFELAGGGTLFLDEIGDISLEVQTKLLRVLQEKTFERVGSSEPVQVDVRLVAATHQDLEQLIRHGRFREDLFYRLNVITLAMPPLRDRADDVPELALHFLKTYAHRCGKPLAQIDDEALLALRAYRWPGNIRELENAVERAVVVADGPVLTVADLPEEVRRAAVLDAPAPLTPPAGGTADGGGWGVRAERELRDRHEREALLRALTAAGGNKAEAARLLGMARSTLVSRLKKHGLLQSKSGA